MYLFGKLFQDIEPDDIKRVVDSGEQESISLEYKREILIEKGDDRKEFLFDILSFYNTEGGVIIYGIEERKDDQNKNTGEPDRIVGLEISNEDQFLLKIEDIIRANTDPSLTRLDYKFLHVDGLQVFVIGIPKNLGLPTMNTYKGSNKFVRRKTTGKYYVDVNELNDMFMQNMAFTEKINLYRKERIDKARNKENFPMLKDGSFCMVHIIPHSYLRNNYMDISTIDVQVANKIFPMNARGATDLFNLDGYALYDKTTNQAYTQFLRNGVIEMYSQLLFYRDKYGEQSLSAKILHEKITRTIYSAFICLHHLGINPPYQIGIHFEDMLGSKLYVNELEAQKFTSKNITLPFVTLASYADMVENVLSPFFDILWQSAGYPKCTIPPIEYKR